MWLRRADFGVPAPSGGRGRSGVARPPGAGTVSLKSTAGGRGGTRNRGREDPRGHDRSGAGRGTWTPGREWPVS